jgi:hypothetical protein
MATVNGTPNDDDLFIASGISGDTLLGLAGNDILDAGFAAGNNILRGGDGNDQLFANTNDQLFGEAGNDILSATDGKGGNTLSGGDGDDTIFASLKDSVFGDAGNDIIFGGLGGNTLTGGLGKDVFWIANIDLPDNPNTISDFNPVTDSIRVDLAGVTQLSDLKIEQVGNNSTISFGSKQITTINDTLISSLNAANLLVLPSAPNNSTVNEAPAINAATFTIDENSDVGKLVGNVVATDPNAGDKLTFAISSGNSDINGNGSSPFVIDSKTGEIKVNDSDDLDFEKVPLFDLAVKVSDAENLEAFAAIKVNLKDLLETTINLAPTINAATFTINENSAVGSLVGRVVATDPNPGDRLTFSLSGGNSDINGNGISAFTIDGGTGEIRVNDSGDLDFENTSAFNLRVRVNDPSNLSAETTVRVNLNNLIEPLQFQKNNSDVFTISGGNKLKPTLSFTAVSNSASQIGELGVFKVDNAAGTIDGLSQGQAGYAEKALSRSRVIFSMIANNPNGFSPNGENRLLDFSNNDNMRFYSINSQSTTTDLILKDRTFSQVTFPSSTSLSWKEVSSSESTIRFNDLDINIKATNDNLLLGTDLQDEREGQVLDLRGVNTSQFSSVKADFTLTREALFDNFVGFYKVENEKGDIKNSDGTIVSVGSSGYTQAAVASRVTGIDLTVRDQSTQTSSGIFTPGSIFAPFIIINGRPDALLDSNLSNDPATYFSYLGANSDGIDHVRLLGNNTFGFEDLKGGGDFDYNDFIVKVKLTPTA